eukprot:403365689
MRQSSLNPSPYVDSQDSHEGQRHSPDISGQLYGRLSLQSDLKKLSERQTQFYSQLKSSGKILNDNEIYQNEYVPSLPSIYKFNPFTGERLNDTRAPNNTSTQGLLNKKNITILGSESKTIQPSRRSMDVSTQNRNSGLKSVENYDSIKLSEVGKRYQASQNLLRAQKSSSMLSGMSDQNIREGQRDAKEIPNRKLSVNEKVDDDLSHEKSDKVQDSLSQQRKSIKSLNKFQAITYGQCLKVAKNTQSVQLAERTHQVFSRIRVLEKELMGRYLDEEEFDEITHGLNSLELSCDFFQNLFSQKKYSSDGLTILNAPNTVTVNAQQRNITINNEGQLNSAINSYNNYYIIDNSLYFPDSSIHQYISDKKDIQDLPHQKIDQNNLNVDSQTHNTKNHQSRDKQSYYQQYVQNRIREISIQQAQDLFQNQE